MTKFKFNIKGVRRGPDHAAPPFGALSARKHTCSVLTIQEGNPPSLLDGLHQARWSVGPRYPNATVSLRLRCVANRSMRFRSRTAVDYAHGL